jgi:hypothetical protein
MYDGRPCPQSCILGVDITKGGTVAEPLKAVNGASTRSSLPTFSITADEIMRHASSIVSRAHRTLKEDPQASEVTVVISASERFPLTATLHKKSAAEIDVRRPCGMLTITRGEMERNGLMPSISMLCELVGGIANNYERFLDATSANRGPRYDRSHDGSRGTHANGTSSRRQVSGLTPVSPVTQVAAPSL